MNIQVQLNRGDMLATVNHFPESEQSREFFSLHVTKDQVHFSWLMDRTQLAAVRFAVADALTPSDTDMDVAFSSMLRLVKIVAEDQGSKHCDAAHAITTMLGLK